MPTDGIEAIGIDVTGSLWVRPASAAFPYIYREGKGVGWDPERLCLYSPKPRQWSYLDWYRRIRDAAREQGVELMIQETTSWSNIEPNLQQVISAANTSG